MHGLSIPKLRKTSRRPAQLNREYRTELQCKKAVERSCQQGWATNISLTCNLGFKKNKNSLATELVISKYVHTNNFQFSGLKEMGKML